MWLTVPMRYTKETLAPAVMACTSFAQVVRFFGRKSNGGNQTHIARRIRAYGLDTTHFTGQRTNSGDSHRGGAAKKPWQEMLVVDRRGGRKELTNRLRRAMIESGIPYICLGEGCRQGPTWLGRPLVLQIEHKNGNSLDNHRTNLCFLCPNCHSQTSTWGSKNLS